MKSRFSFRFFLLSLMALLVAGVAIASTSASAEEKVEAPYWRVQGKRLEMGQSRSAAFEPSEATVIKTSFKEGKTEIRCKELDSEEAAIKGSNPGSDLKLSAELLLKGCTLSILGHEETGCEVTVETPKLAVKGWYEGPKGTEGTNVVLLFEEQLIAKIVVKATKSCLVAGKYLLEGSFAANYEPQNTYITKAKIKIPATPITAVWQPQGAGEERKPSLTLNGEPVTLQGGLLLALLSSEEFGAFTK